jgi:hypothetical protein
LTHPQVDFPYILPLKQQWAAFSDVAEEKLRVSAALALALGAAAALEMEKQ